MLSNQKIIKKREKDDMGIQLITVWKGITIAFSNIFTTLWGKILIIGSFIGATFAGISGLIHVILILCLVDLILGIIVTIKTKGVDHILSARLRDSLIKVFFYLILIMGLFLIETQLVDGYYLTSKAIFALIAGVELLSITANTLLIAPNMPVFKIFKKMLTKEMSKKLGITEEEIIKELEPNNKKENVSKNDDKKSIIDN